MGETLVLCGGATGSPNRRVSSRSHLNLSGPGANISLRIEDISRRMIANLPHVLTDLLEVATYVYCADQLISRGGAAMQALGSDWRRRLSFAIPVREPDRWERPEVNEALIRLLAFMSDEDFSFRFEPASSPASADSYFDFSGRGDAAFQADEVALFSGGLDSLTGAVDQLENTQTRLLLVSHQSSPKIIERQRYLAGELASRFPKRVFHVPVRITKRGAKAVETTQRTRSFLFAALAAAVGKLAGQKGLTFYENGVVSFNLPIANQVVGARATRSTHPRVIRDLKAFLSALLDEPVEVGNPYIWKTKSEVASIIGRSSHQDLVRHSISCSHVYGITTLKTHCGRCSQCLDRRFATLAADVADSDPEEMYDIDLLTGPRDEGQDRVMAENFVRHAWELGRLSEMGFVGRFGGQIARASGGFPGITADQVVKNAIDLHQRHGQAIVSVLEAGFRKHAHALASGTLPSSCILRLVGNADGHSSQHIRDPTEVEGLSPQGETRDLTRTSEIRIALDRAKRQVMIEGIEPIKGPASFDLVTILLYAHEKDRSDGRAPENHRYVPTWQLTKTLGIADYVLRRRVERLRNRVANSFERRFGLPLEGDAVVQNQPWRGYRLNPMVRVVAFDQIDGGA